MPNRIIKESIRTSKSVNAVKDFDFRLWVYLITYVDDYGRGSADTEILKGFVLPRRKGVTEANISDALHNLACAGLVSLYEIEGEPFLCFPNWDVHQTIRAKVSKFPAPCKQLQADEIICKQMQADASKCSRNPIQSNPNPNTKEILSNESTKKTASRFSPPTIEEVSDYCRERKNSVDAQHFIDYYEANGWRVGKNAMKDWQACVRNWEKNGYSNGPKTSEPQSFDVNDAFEKALNRHKEA